MKSKIAIVTGGSSGIGRSTALALLRKGCRVYDFSRHDRGVDGILHMDCDVSDERQFAAAVADVAEREGRIDILINNAGFGISGAAEYTENEDAKRLLDVNLFGVVNGCKAVIPYMRRQGSGRIINLSSVAAVVPIPFQAWYSVSKAAVSTYTAALRNELKGFGLSVCSVMPGDIRSGFTAAREKCEAGDDIYGDRIRRNVAKMEHDEENGMAPEVAGEYIAGLALRPRVKPQYAIGFQYKLFSVLAGVCPGSLKSALIAQLYAGGENAYKASTGL